MGEFFRPCKVSPSLSWCEAWIPLSTAWCDKRTHSWYCRKLGTISAVTSCRSVMSLLLDTVTVMRWGPRRMKDNLQGNVDGKILSHVLSIVPLAGRVPSLDVHPLNPHYKIHYCSENAEAKCCAVWWYFSSTLLLWVRQLRQTKEVMCSGAKSSLQNIKAARVTLFRTKT